MKATTLYRLRLKVRILAGEMTPAALFGELQWALENDRITRDEFLELANLPLVGLINAPGGAS